MIDTLCSWVAVVLLATQVAGTAITEGGAGPAAEPAAVGSTLTIVDEAGVKHTLAPSNVAKLPRQTVKVTSHDKEAEFSGPALMDVLKSCGVEFGEKLKGRHASTVAVLDAADGYRIVITLLEIDPATTDKIAVLADQRDGSPLGTKEGPYRLVLPGEKREIRSIRNVSTIHIVNLKDLPVDKSGEGEHAQK
jgi:hypothetical protein